MMFTLLGLFHICLLSQDYISLSYQGILYVWASGLCSLYAMFCYINFNVTLVRLKNTVHYAEDFVI